VEIRKVTARVPGKCRPSWMVGTAGALRGHRKGGRLTGRAGSWVILTGAGTPEEKKGTGGILRTAREKNKRTLGLALQDLWESSGILLNGSETRRRGGRPKGFQEGPEGGNRGPGVKTRRSGFNWREIRFWRGWRARRGEQGSRNRTRGRGCTASGASTKK